MLGDNIRVDEAVKVIRELELTQAELNEAVNIIFPPLSPEVIRADWDEYIDSLGPGERGMTHDEFLTIFYDTEDPEVLAVIESLSPDWFE